MEHNRCLSDKLAKSVCDYALSAEWRKHIEQVETQTKRQLDALQHDVKEMREVRPAPRVT